MWQELKIKAWALGLYQVRITYTQGISSFPLNCSYAISGWAGRALAHTKFGVSCLVLLQVPKCFVLVQIFWASPKNLFAYCASFKHFVPDKCLVHLLSQNLVQVYSNFLSMLNFLCILKIIWVYSKVRFLYINWLIWVYLKCFEYT